jgi:hypothetical protein
MDWLLSFNQEKPSKVRLNETRLPTHAAKLHQHMPPVLRRLTRRQQRRDLSWNLSRHQSQKFRRRLVRKAELPPVEASLSLLCLKDRRRNPFNRNLMMNPCFQMPQMNKLNSKQGDSQQRQHRHLLVALCPLRRRGCRGYRYAAATWQSNTLTVFHIFHFQATVQAAKFPPKLPTRESASPARQRQSDERPAGQRLKWTEEEEEAYVDSNKQCFRNFIIRRVVLQVEGRH